MVYLLPICLDAQIPRESNTVKRKLLDSTSKITDTSRPDNSDSVDNLAADEVNSYANTNDEETKTFLLVVGIIGFGVALYWVLQIGCFR